MDVTGFRITPVVLLAITLMLCTLHAGGMADEVPGPPEPVDENPADPYANFRASGRAAVAKKDEVAAEKVLLAMPEVDLPQAVMAGDTLLVELVALGDPDRIARSVPSQFQFQHMRRAAENMDLPMLRNLIRCGFNVPDGYSGLEWAANHGHTNIVQVFADAGLDLNVCDKVWKGTPLQQAMAGHHTAVVDQLLKHGVDVNVGNKHGWTPLHTAARRGQIDYAEKLLAHGANANAISNERLAPVHEAILYRQFDFARWLLKHGATLDAPAVAGLGDLATLKRLFPDPLIYDPLLAGGPSPIFMAAKANQLEVVKYFVAAGVDVNLTDSATVPLIVHAAEFGSTEVVAYLVKQQADLNLRPTRGAVARHFSALHAGDAATIRLLLDRGMPVDLPTFSSETPLEVAVKRGDLATVQLLAERGA